jgi:hypothetical protein
MHDDDRYTRQRRLREIGDAGQARLLAASVSIPGGAEAVAELVYLHRAGVGSVSIDALSRPEAFVHAAEFRHEAARRHAASAWRALRTICAVVGTDGASGAPS